VTHVEKAEARESAEFEETLVQELLLHLAELHGGHFRAIRRELAVSLRF